MRFLESSTNRWIIAQMLFNPSGLTLHSIYRIIKINVSSLAAPAQLISANVRPLRLFVRFFTRDFNWTRKFHPPNCEGRGVRFARKPISRKNSLTTKKKMCLSAKITQPRGRGHVQKLGPKSHPFRWWQTLTDPGVFRTLFFFCLDLSRSWVG